MPRRSRGGGKRRSPERENLTWVYTPLWGFPFNEGGGGQTAMPMVQSRETWSLNREITVPIQTQAPMSPLLSQQKIRAYEVDVLIAQSEWSIASNTYALFAVLPGIQDPADGQMIVPPVFALDNPDFVGIRKLGGTHILWSASQDSGGRYRIKMRWRGRLTLRDNEGLFLFWDHIGADSWGAVTVFARTLMVAE